MIYDTAPVGLAFLSPDCRYLQINQRLTDICGLSVAEHLGRSVRETVPQVADQVEQIVRSVIDTGAPIIGIEVHGQRADNSNIDHVWVTHWHPLRAPDGVIVGVNVVAEDVTARKRAEAAVKESERALRESEARFRELADSISQFAWTADETGWIYWYNKRWHEYAGTTLEEMQGWGWQKVHHPDHVERVVRRIRQCFESGEPWEDTFPLRARDGSYRWFLSRARPIRDEAGRLVRWFGTNTDVTDQMEAEQALRALNETLGERVAAEIRERLQIWNVSEDFLVVADLDGNCLSANPAWTTTLGWSEQELCGKPAGWLVHPDDRERSRAELGKLAHDRKAVRFENRIRHKDGSYRWLSWRAVPDRDRIYATARDVTELKEAETALREARRELTQVARRATLSAVSAAIAHEVKQPLGAMVMHANAGLRWLNRPVPDLEKVRHSLEDIVADGHRGSDVVRAVRAMFDRTDQVGASLDLAGVVHDTVALVHADLDAAKIAIKLDLAPSLPQVLARRGELQQVLLNLITNAADAMRSIDGRNRVLTLSCGSIEDAIALAVADSGAGIPSENTDRIFETFFTTKPNGMGMGLAICRSIIESHGGTLSFSPGVPHGSVFRIVLPAQCGPGGEAAAGTWA